MLAGSTQKALYAMSFSDRPLAYRLALVLLPISAVLYFVSLTMDVVVVETTVKLFGIGRTTVDHLRLLTTIESLYKAGEMVLTVLITAFTIVFPVGKYLALAFVMARFGESSSSRVLTWIKNLGQWSMGDVFVVALLVVVLRINSAEQLAHLNVIVQPGLWVFAGSVILAMVVSALLGFVDAQKPAAASPSEVAPTTIPS